MASIHLLAADDEFPSPLEEEPAGCVCGRAISGRPFFGIRYRDGRFVLSRAGQQVPVHEAEGTKLSVRHAEAGFLGGILFVTMEGALYTCTLEARVSLVSRPSDGTKFERVACGSRHCLALTADGRVFSWGSGSRGQLGHGGDDDSAEPRLVTLGRR